MSQVLEKPILLDETGQAIAGKLDTNADAIVDVLEDIKDAIGTSSEFIPVMIKVVTPPTKTLYNVGERLNLSGMVVNLIGTNGVQIDVTQACTFVPANNTVLTAANTSVAITYHYAADNIDFSTSQALTIRALDSIAVTTPPIKTAYQTGETLDLTGIVVTATYSDGYTANVTPDCTFNPANGTVLSSSDTSVTITYTEGGTTKTTTAEIGVKELLSIAVTHLPTKTSYKTGEALDLTGIVVTASYDNGSSLDVTSRCTYSPADGSTLTTSNTSVAISYTEGSITKTTSQTIVVRELISIAITTPPTTTQFSVGDSLDLTGMVVTATYNDNSTADVTSSCVFNPTEGTTLTTSDGSVSVSYTEVNITKTTSQSITVAYPYYGVEWDGSATQAMTRTDLAADFVDPVAQMSDGNGGWTAGSSPFDNIMPWAGMEVVNDATGGKLVKIPKFWYKWTKTGSTLKLQIANTAQSGFHVSPAHADHDYKGERDYVYVGAYMSSNTYKSETNKTRYKTTIKTARTAIYGLDTTNRQYNLWDYAMLCTLQMLYLVEYANWNFDATVGKGGYTAYNTGQTDAMTYHTGTTATTRSSNAANVRYRYIEDPWGGTSYGAHVDGVGFSNTNMYCAKYISLYSSSPTAGTDIGAYAAGNYIKELTPSQEQGLEYALLPTDKTNVEDSYIGGSLTVNNGSYNVSALSVQTGIFKFKSNPLAKVSSYVQEVTAECYFRLMKLPANS